MLNLWRQRLDEQRDRLGRSMKSRWQEWQAHLQKAVMQLEGLSPLKTLERGYSLTFDEKTHALLHDAAQTHVDATIKIQLHRGSLLARVIDIEWP